MFDIERLKRYAKEIREGIRLIRKYTQSEEEFFNDERNILSVKHLFLQCIEACALICNHILVKYGKVAPSGYRECFKGLVDTGIISKELGERLQQIAGFRHMLVHQYWRVDDRKVFEYARKDVEDFEKFLKEIGNFLKENL